MTVEAKTIRLKEIRRAVERLELKGVTWARWARSQKFPKSAVMKVVRGRSLASRGQAHRIADALFESAWGRQAVPQARAALPARLEAAYRSADDLLEALESLLGLWGTVTSLAEPCREELRLEVLARTRRLRDCEKRWRQASARAHRFVARERGGIDQ